MVIRLFEVGGSVRDELLGLKVKDRDFAVEVSDDLLPPTGVDEAFYTMKDYLEKAGFHIFVTAPRFGTIRALFPKGHTWGKKLTADFVLCRNDGPSSDGRRPDYVEVGTIFDDLARRDFTVNAMAREIKPDDLEPGKLLDPHDGLHDLKIERLRFVGDPMTRLREDGLRALRAIRFKVQKGFEFDQGIRDALMNPETETLLAGTSVERRREELEKCFHHDTLGTMELLTHDLRPELLQSIFTGKLRLSPTMKRDYIHAQSSQKGHRD